MSQTFESFQNEEGKLDVFTTVKKKYILMSPNAVTIDRIGYSLITLKTPFKKCTNGVSFSLLLDCMHTMSSNVKFGLGVIEDLKESMKNDTDLACICGCTVSSNKETQISLISTPFGISAIIDGRFRRICDNLDDDSAVFFVQFYNACGTVCLNGSYNDLSGSVMGGGQSYNKQGGNRNQTGYQRASQPTQRQFAANKTKTSGQHSQSNDRRQAGNVGSTPRNHGQRQGTNSGSTSRNDGQQTRGQNNGQWQADAEELGRVVKKGIGRAYHAAAKETRHLVNDAEYETQKFDRAAKNAYRVASKETRHFVNEAEDGAEEFGRAAKKDLGRLYNYAANDARYAGREIKKLAGSAARGLKSMMEPSESALQNDSPFGTRKNDRTSAPEPRDESDDQEDQRGNSQSPSNQSTDDENDNPGKNSKSSITLDDLNEMLLPNSLSEFNGAIENDENDPSCEMYKRLDPSGECTIKTCQIENDNGVFIIQIQNTSSEKLKITSFDITNVIAVISYEGKPEIRIKSGNTFHELVKIGESVFAVNQIGDVINAVAVIGPNTQLSIIVRSDHRFETFCFNLNDEMVCLVPSTHLSQQH